MRDTIPRRYARALPLIARAPKPVRIFLARRALKAMSRPRRDTLRWRMTKARVRLTMRFDGYDMYPRPWFARVQAIRARAAYLKPFRYVYAMEYGQAMGGQEEGGWWYSFWEPVAVHRVPLWSAKAALTRLEATGTVDRTPRYTFTAPAAADTDPMADYTPADDLAAVWHDGEVRCRISPVRPKAGNDYAPYC